MMFAKLLLFGFVQATDRLLQKFNLELNPDGNFDYNDPEVISPIAERFDNSMLYTSQHMKIRGDSQKPIGPNFKGKNEITCSWTSKQIDRKLTECCSLHS